MNLLFGRKTIVVGKKTDKTFWLGFPTRTGRDTRRIGLEKSIFNLNQIYCKNKLKYYNIVKNNYSEIKPSLHSFVKCCNYIIVIFIYNNNNNLLYSSRDFIFKIICKSFHSWLYTKSHIFKKNIQYWTNFNLYIEVNNIYFTYECTLMKIKDC
jgi:hypothetical protein